MGQVQSNMVFFWLDKSLPLDAPTLYKKLDENYDVRLDVIGPRMFRAVTHYWITPERIDTALAAIRETLGAA